MKTKVGQGSSIKNGALKSWLESGSPKASTPVRNSEFGENANGKEGSNGADAVKVRKVNLVASMGLVLLQVILLKSSGIRLKVGTFQM